MMNWVKFHHCIAGKIINVIVTKPTFIMFAGQAVKGFKTYRLCVAILVIHLRNYLLVLSQTQSTEIFDSNILTYHVVHTIEFF